MDVDNIPSNRLEWLTLPLGALILANLAPVYGVIFLGWKVFPVVLLFWLENVVIGFFNVVKMFFAGPSNPVRWLGKLFMIPFFCVHYGMFTMVHGVFVFAMFGGQLSHGMGSFGIFNFMPVLKEQQIFYPAVVLFFSHGFSFFWNYIGKGEYRKASLQDLMGSPYGRVVVLHITILFGGFLMMALNSPMLGLLLLVVLKIVLDVKSHIRERKKFGSGEARDAVKVD